MKFIKITYGWPKKFKFVPANGQNYKVLGLEICAIENDDSSYTIDTFDHKLSDPNNVASELVPVDKSFVVKVDEKIWASYCTIAWSYLKGKYHSQEDFTAEIVNDDVALAETDDDVVKALVYYNREDYQKALELITPLLEPDQYYRVNEQAHQLLALMYELGYGVERDRKKAYIHYLYARDYEGFYNLFYHGFGKGVLENPDALWRNNDWDEYHVLLLLDNIGESDYAYNAMLERADTWFYLDEEKKTKRADYKHNHKYVALARKTACLWAMDRCDYTFGASEKFLLFAGAYCSYLSQGHEGACSYVSDNGGGSVAHLTSASSAEWWLNKAIQEGNEFAICAKVFIAKAKEQ